MKHLKLFLFFSTLFFMNMPDSFACGCSYHSPTNPNDVCGYNEEVNYYSTNCEKRELFYAKNYIYENGQIVGHTCGTTLLAGAHCSFVFDLISTNLPSEKHSNPSLQCGSVIHAEELALQESFHVYGANYDLNYVSSRSSARADYLSFSIEISKPSDVNVSSIKVTHTRFGIDYITTYSASSSNVYQYQWDGLQGGGSPALGGLEHKVAIDYVYNDGTKKRAYETSPAISNFNTNAYGLGGLTFDPLHFLDTITNTLYMGDGRTLPIKPIPIFKNTSGEVQKVSQGHNFYMIHSPDEEQVFIFNLDGTHFSTNSSLTGAEILVFNYEPSLEIKNIQGPHGLVVSFSRTPGKVLITSKFGRITTLNLNANSLAGSIVDPLQNTHTLLYNASGQLSSYTNSVGLVTSILYDSKGRLTSDSHNTLFSKSYSVSIDNTETREIIESTAEGLSTKFRSDFIGGKLNKQTITYPDSTQRIVQYSN